MVKYSRRKLRLFSFRKINTAYYEREVINMVFKNVYLESHGIYYSRIIASWINVGGNIRTLSDRKAFKKWLTSLEIADEDILQIVDLATNGKLEYEHDAKKFIANLKETDPEIKK